MRERRHLYLAATVAVATLLLSTLPGHATEGGPSGAQPSVLDDEFKLVAEPTVTAASKRVQLLSEAPSSVTIITSEEIQRFGYLSLGDLLDTVAGFYVSNDRNYSYLGVRGFARPGDYNSRVLFLLNGHPTNENLYDSSTLGPDAGFDMDSIDHVEIVRGPGSALYGTNAVFAVINVVTLNGSQIDGARATVLGGDRGRAGSAISYGNRTPSGVDYRISASFLRSRGEDLFFPEFDDPSTNFGVAEGLDAERDRAGSFQVEFGDWQIQGFHTARRKEVPTASFGTEFNNDAYAGRDTLSMIDAQYERRVSRSMEIRARAYYDNYDFRCFYPYPGPPTVINDDTGSSQWAGEEVALAWQHRSSHRLTLGQAFEITPNTLMRNFDQDPYWEYIDKSVSYAQWSVYFQDEWKPTGWLSLNAGARADRYSGFRTMVTPRLGVFLYPDPASAVKILVGSAYRAPNVYERFYKDNVTMAPPGDLYPEKATSYELAYERTLSRLGRLSVSAFRNDVRNLLTPVLLPSGLSQVTNEESAVTQGLETEVRFTRRGGLMGYGSASYVGGEEGGGRWLTNSPKVIFKTGVSVPLAARSLFASAEYLHIGERRTLAGDTADPLRRLNMSLIWRLREHRTALSATVFNVLDHDNYAPGSFEHAQDTIVQPGRWFLVRFSAHL